MQERTGKNMIWNPVLDIGKTPGAAKLAAAAASKAVADALVTRVARGVDRSPSDVVRFAQSHVGLRGMEFVSKEPGYRVALWLVA